MVESGMVYQITVDGTTLALEGIRAYFQSQRAGLDAHLVARLVTFLDDAHDSIDCAIYDLRHPRILEALARAVERGVQVRIAYDAGKEHDGQQRLLERRLRVVGGEQINDLVPFDSETYVNSLFD